MADDFIGYGLGEGAEAFSRNMNAALRFRQARADQQFQQGLALERKELEAQRVDLAQRRIEMSAAEVQRGIAQQETLEKEIEDLLTTATGPRGQVSENITKTPQFRRKAIRLKAKGVDVDKLLGIDKQRGTETERFFARLHDPATPEDQKQQIAVMLGFTEKKKEFKFLNPSELDQTWQDFFELIPDAERLLEENPDEFTDQINFFGAQRYPGRWIPYPKTQAVLKAKTIPFTGVKIPFTDPAEQRRFRTGAGEIPEAEVPTGQVAPEDRDIFIIE